MNVETIRPSQPPETLGNPRDPEGLAKARKRYLHEATEIAGDAVNVTFLQAEQEYDERNDSSEALAA